MIQSTEDLIREARLHDWGPNVEDYDLPARLIEALEWHSRQEASLRDDMGDILNESGAQR